MTELCLVTLSHGRRLPCANPDSRGGDPPVSGSYSQHDKQPFMPTAYLLVAMLQASWVDKQVRFTRGSVFTDTILNRSDLIKVRKSQERQE